MIESGPVRVETRDIKGTCDNLKLFKILFESVFGNDHFFEGELMGMFCDYFIRRKLRNGEG